VKSKGDPILDLQAICQEKPSSEKELKAGFKALGWEVPFKDVFSMAQGVYIEKGADGLYHARGGTTEEILAKVKRGGT
jgi:hypothetical protein